MRGIVAGTTFVLLLGSAHAGEIARHDYLHYLPLGHPRLVQQTAASASLHLFGDRQSADYRDVDPVDGIDDNRQRTLLDLAVRFAPYLVQNSTNMPTNFDLYIENRHSFPLFIDHWEISSETSRLTQTEAINFSVLGGEECSDTSTALTAQQALLATDNASLEDCKLQKLLREYAPWDSATTLGNRSYARQRPETNSVLFFDFPGDGPDTWRDAYEGEYGRTPENRRNAFPHSYVHPFLTTVRDSSGSSLGYDLVLQYWFFYPTNDGGNNHEGDWEHLNVVVAPRSKVEHPLSARTVQEILDGELQPTDEAVDPLVIRRIEYYFHHFVMTVDFSSPNVYLPRAEWKELVKERDHGRLRENEIWGTIRDMAYVDDDETRINTHPLGYVGADNKGFDQALSAPGGKNRNSHGTFPFPGRYINIGPAGATEQISLYVDPKEHMKKVNKHGGALPPAFKRGGVIGLADPERLRIVPDWERIIEPVRTDAMARRHWSWMLLPIRWGYPATESPLAGILPHADTGNLAPHGPTFSTGWNVSGPAPGFHAYEPHTLAAIFPLRLQDGFRNDLGFFNLTLPVLFNLPPLDFLSRLGTYPFKLAFSRRDPVYYPKEELPFRFVGLSSGVSIQKLSEDFNVMALNPQQYDEFLLSLLGHLVESGFDSTTTATSSNEFLDTSVQPFFQVPFYIGKGFVSENTVRNVQSTFGFSIGFNNIPSYSYSADLNYWEYAGSLRYSITSSSLQPYVKAGYGWSWYRLENVRTNGVPFQVPTTDWIKPKRIWPNVWHVGVGLEYIPWKNVGTFPGGTELSLRFEYGRYMETLGVDLSSITLNRLSIAFPTLGDVPLNTRVARNDFLFGLTLSF